MIEINQISKAYGEKTILDNISIAFPKGKIVALIGGNGTGKSTLLSVISRLLKQDEGQVFLDHRNVTELSTREFAKHLSILKQSNNPALRLTIRELVSFGRFPHTQGRLTQEDQLKIDDALEFMNLTAIQHQYVDELSGGQRQRTFLAMSLVQDTAYMLLDEPLNNLDLKHSVDIMRILKRLSSEFGKSIIVVLHDINFAAAYADYLVALKDREVLYHGPTAEILKADKLKKIFDLDMEVIMHEQDNYCIYFKS